MAAHQINTETNPGQAIVLTGPLESSIDIRPSTVGAIIDSINALLLATNHTNHEIRFAWDGMVQTWRILMILGNAMHIPPSDSDSVLGGVLGIFKEYVPWDETFIYRVNDVADCAGVMPGWEVFAEQWRTEGVRADWVNVKEVC